MAKPTIVATTEVPIYAKLGAKDYQVGAIELDVEAGEPITREDGSVYVPLKVKDVDWGQVIVTTD